MSESITDGLNVGAPAEEEAAGRCSTSDWKNGWSKWRRNAPEMWYAMSSTPATSDIQWLRVLRPPYIYVTL